jgi:hypothetical protein
MIAAAPCARLLLASAALAVTSAAAPRGEAPRQEPGAASPALLRELGFLPEEVRRIDDGEVAARGLDPEPHEIALAVATSMRITPSFYLERFREITSFKRTAEVLQIGRIGGAPSTGDFAALTLESDDVKDLRRCRLDDCGLKLDRAGIERLARRDAALASASAGMREFLAAYARAYLQGGNGALIEYRDDKPARRISADLRGILDRSGYLQRGWPGLFRAVGEFGGILPAGHEGFLYWSKEKVGPRAVVSVTHVVISPPAPGGIAVATKQIYASHYSDASLGVTLLIERPSRDGPRTLVVYTNRTRLDVFGGILGGLKRPIVRSRARDGAERTMRRLREKLEREFRAVHG